MVSYLSRPLTYAQVGNKVFKNRQKVSDFYLGGPLGASPRKGDTHCPAPWIVLHVQFFMLIDQFV